MANAKNRILGQYLGTSWTELFEVPVGKVWTLSAVPIANNDTAERALYLAHTDGSAAGAQTTSIPGVPVTVGQAHEVGRGWIFRAGDKFWGKSDAANKISVTIYYAEEAE